MEEIKTIREMKNYNLKVNAVYSQNKGEELLIINQKDMVIYRTNKMLNEIYNEEYLLRETLISNGCNVSDETIIISGNELLYRDGLQMIDLVKIYLKL